MKTRGLILIFMLCFTVLKAEPFEFSEPFQQCYLDIHCLRFKKAGQFINSELERTPGNPALCYLENQLYFFKAFISEEDDDFETLKSGFDKRLHCIEESGGGSPWRDYARSEMMMQLALVKLKHKEYLTSGYYLRKAYKMAEENFRKHPDFAPNLKTLGFFHAVIGAVPDNYSWLANLAGMHGTIKQGSGELTSLLKIVKANPSYRFLEPEAYFLRIFIATHFEKDTTMALSLLKEMQSGLNVRGPLQVFITANTQLSAAQQPEALKTLNAFEQDPSSYPLHYLNYLKGMLKLNQLNKDCATDFKNFISGYKGNSFVKSAYHKLAWLHFINDDTASYRNVMKQVLLHGNDFTDEDKQAAKDAASAELPNKFLLKARLYFDGGDYTSSLKELAGKPSGSFSRFRDQLEYTYRLARIFDKKNQKDKAIHYYTATYENGSGHPYYFAANAALLIAVIYEDKKDNNKATEWYRKCLAMRNHEYQNSIDQKAEAGLNRLSKNSVN